jgi:hypothetical protein
MRFFGEEGIFWAFPPHRCSVSGDFPALFRAEPLCSDSATLRLPGLLFHASKMTHVECFVNTISTCLLSKHVEETGQTWATMPISNGAALLSSRGGKRGSIQLLAVELSPNTMKTYPIDKPTQSAISA